MKLTYALAVSLAVIASTALATRSASAQDYTAIVDNASGTPGSELSIAFRLEVAPGVESLGGFSFSFLCPDDMLIPIAVEPAAAMTELNGGTGPTFLHVDTFSSPGGTGISCGTVFSITGVDSLPAGQHHALNMIWEISAAASTGTTSTIEYCNCLGNPIVDSIVVDSSGTSHVPAFVIGEVDIVDSLAYIRSDSNVDGTFNIADPVHLLGYLFLQGPGPCLDAMDANADGNVNLPDALYMLSAHNGTGPLPSTPFPECGTMESLGCDSFDACP